MKRGSLNRAAWILAAIISGSSFSCFSEDKDDAVFVDSSAVQVKTDPAPDAVPEKDATKTTTTPGDSALPPIATDAQAANPQDAAIKGSGGEIKKSDSNALQPANPADRKPQDTALEAAKGDAPVVAAADLEVPLTEYEQKIKAMLTDAFASRPFLKTRKPIDLLARDAVLKAIDRNLPIQRQQKEEIVAAAAREEARAVFDPIFTVSDSYSRLIQFTRAANVSTFQRGTTVLHPGNNPSGPGVEDTITTVNPQFPVEAFVFKGPRTQGFVDKQNFGSNSQVNGPDEQQNFNLSINQQLPWGPAVFLSYGANKNRTFFDDGGNTTKFDLASKIHADAQAKNNAIQQDPNKTTAEKLASSATFTAADQAFQVATQEFKKTINKFQSFNRPWTSSLNADLVLPVPYLKDFGPYASADVGLKLADLTKERVFWDTKNVINVTLVSVDHAYWDLVSSIEFLYAINENERELQILAGDIKKLLDAQRTTEYGQVQVQAQLAAIKQQEEAGWALYIQASDVLVNLLDLEKDVILVPRGYSKSLTERMIWNADEAYALAMANRPDLMSQNIQGRVSQLLVNFNKNQAKPNLKFGTNATLAQDGSQFGFGSWSESLFALFGIGKSDKHFTRVEKIVHNVPFHKINNNLAPDGNPEDIQLNDPNKPFIDENGIPSAIVAHGTIQRDRVTGPDDITRTHTLTYNYPVGNRALKAALREAEADNDNQETQIQITKTGVEADVGNALVNLMSSKVQMDIAESTYQLTRDSAIAATQLLAIGRITEFESITRVTDELNADLNRINANIQFKKAESQLLEAEGILPNQYPQRTSLNDFDQHRLGALAHGHVLNFFKPIKTAATETPGAASVAHEAPKDTSPAQELKALSSEPDATAPVVKGAQTSVVPDVRNEVSGK